MATVVGIIVATLIFGFLSWCILFLDYLSERRKENRESKYGRNGPGCLVRIWWVIDWLFRVCFSLGIYVCVIVLPFFAWVLIFPVQMEVHTHDFNFTELKLVQSGGVIQFSPETDLDPETQQVTSEAKARIETELGGTSKLGHSTWKALTRYGQEIAAKNARSNGDSPLSLSEAEAERLALMRLSGRDEQFSQGYQKIIEETQKLAIYRDESVDKAGPSYLRELDLYAMLCHVFYPNDEVGFVVFGGHWAEEQREGSTFDWILGAVATSMVFLLLAVVVQRGMRKISVSLLGRILLISDDSTFEDYREAVFNPYRMMITTLVVTALAFGTKILFLDPLSILYLSTVSGMFIAVLWSALMGGVLVESIGNVVTLLFIRIGRDPLETWWDNIITGILGFMVLAMAFNGPSSILSGVLLGSATSLIYKWVGRH